MHIYAAASVCFFLPFVFCGLWFANNYIHQLEYITFKVKTSFSKNSSNNKQTDNIYIHAHMHAVAESLDFCVLDLLGDAVFSFVQPAILTVRFPGIHWSVHETGDGASDYLYPFCTRSRLWPDPDRESLSTIDWLYTQLVWGKLKWNKHSSKCQRFIQWSALLLCSSMVMHQAYVFRPTFVFVWEPL